MIEVVLHALPLDGPPVVTTFESIDKNAVQEALGPVMARLVYAIEEITRVRPAGMTLVIQWAGEDEAPPKEEKKPAGPSKPVPKWMS